MYILAPSLAHNDQQMCALFILIIIMTCWIGTRDSEMNKMLPCPQGAQKYGGRDMTDMQTSSPSRVVSAMVALCARDRQHRGGGFRKGLQEDVITKLSFKKGIFF